MGALSWSGDGAELLGQDRATNGLALFDARAGPGPVLTTDNVHQGKGREGRLLWLANEGRILTSGFSKVGHTFLRLERMKGDQWMAGDQTDCVRQMGISDKGIRNGI